MNGGMVLGWVRRLKCTFVRLGNIYLNFENKLRVYAHFSELFFSFNVSVVLS